MDPDALRLELEVDAAHVAVLTLAGRTAEADAYIETSGYRVRLEQWLAGRESLPQPLDR